MLGSHAETTTDNLLDNNSFTTDTSGWTLSDTNQDKVKRDPATYSGSASKSMRFRYQGGSISQDIDTSGVDSNHLIQNINMTFDSIGCGNTGGEWCNGGADDTLTSSITLSNGSSTEVVSHTTAVPYENGWHNYSFTESVDGAFNTNDTSVNLTITGNDTGNSGNWWGPIIDNINFTLTTEQYVAPEPEPEPEPEPTVTTLIEGLDLSTEIINDVILDQPIEVETALPTLDVVPEIEEIGELPEIQEIEISPEVPETIEVVTEVEIVETIEAIPDLPELEIVEEIADIEEIQEIEVVEIEVEPELEPEPEVVAEVEPEVEVNPEPKEQTNEAKTETTQAVKKTDGTKKQATNKPKPKVGAKPKVVAKSKKSVKKKVKPKAKPKAKSKPKAKKTAKNKANKPTERGKSERSDTPLGVDITLENLIILTDVITITETIDLTQEMIYGGQQVDNLNTSGVTLAGLDNNSSRRWSNLQNESKRFKAPRYYHRSKYAP